MEIQRSVGGKRGTPIVDIGQFHALPNGARGGFRQRAQCSGRNSSAVRGLSQVQLELGTAFRELARKDLLLKILIRRSHAEMGMAAQKQLIELRPQPSQAGSVIVSRNLSQRAYGRRLPRICLVSLHIAVAQEI